MTALLWLLPIALGLGIIGLAGFFWALNNGQFEDTKGDGSRIFHDDDKPLVDKLDEQP